MSSGGLLFKPFDPFNLFVLLMWSADQATRHPFAVSGVIAPSRKIEFGPTRRPRNTTNGVQYDSRSPQNSKARREDRSDPGLYRCRCDSGDPGRHFLNKWGAASVNRQEILDEFARDRQGRPIAVASS